VKPLASPNAGHLKVEGLTVSVGGPGPTLLEDVSFDLPPGNRLALLGTSGSGKSVTASALLRLLRPPLVVTSGRVLVDDVDLYGLDGRSMREHRGRSLFMIFQSPGTALNPCTNILTQVRRAAERREPSRAAALTIAAQALDAVGLNLRQGLQFPFELSGGMQQRVLVAMALALEPRVLLADEPTTGLDSLAQREVLRALEVMLERTGASLLFITHDLRAANVLCRNAMVLDRGRLVAKGPLSDFLTGQHGPAAHALARSAAEADR